MLSQDLGRILFELVCAACGLLILAMAATEWRRLRLAEYGHMAVAAGVLLVGRTLALLALQTGVLSDAIYLEWALEGLTLVLFIWAYLFATFSELRWTILFLAAGLAGVGLGLVVHLIDGGALLSISEAVSPGGIVLLLVSGYGFFRWLRFRRRSTLWVGGAFAFSFVGMALGLFLGQQIVLVSHTGALGLFVVETYRSILSDSRIFGRESEPPGEQVVHDNQEPILLLELSQTVVSSLDLSVVLQQASEVVARAMGADWGYVLLPLDESVNELSVVARYGWWGRRKKQDAQVHRQVIVRLGDFSLLRHAVTLRRQVLANDPRDFEQFDRLHDLLGRPQSGPTLVQPICWKDQVLGVVLLGHVDKQQLFTQTDGRLCQALVVQVAVAIENARLYQKLEARVQSLADSLLVRQEEAGERLSILQSIADGVLVVRETGELLFINEAAESILGLPGDLLAGDAIQSLISDLRDPDGQASSDQRVVRWNGSVVEGTLSPVQTEDGTILDHVAVLRDVTRRQSLELAKDRVIESAARELRSYLTSVEGAVDYARSDASGQQPVRDRQQMERSVDRAGRMVALANSLIVMCETEPGTIPIHTRPVDMKVVIREAVEAVRARATEARLDIAVNLPADLSPARGDPQALRQIMDNLLENAVCFTPEGGRVSIWAAEASLQSKDEGTQDHVVISIRDTGVGIPSEEQQRVFARFYRLETPLSFDDDGSGLGLAVVRSLVESHGGQILVESEPGEGTTFSLAIPAAEHV